MYLKHTGVSSQAMTSVLMTVAGLDGAAVKLEDGPNNTPFLNVLRTQKVIEGSPMGPRMDHLRG
jgi:hypothetical protein